MGSILYYCKASRELYEVTTSNGSHCVDWLSVGGMGHILSTAVGFAKNASKKKVLCLDGDGSMLMHMGSANVIADGNLSNLLHIVLIMVFTNQWEFIHLLQVQILHYLCQRLQMVLGMNTFSHSTPWMLLLML